MQAVQAVPAGRAEPTARVRRGVALSPVVTAVLEAPATAVPRAVAQGHPARAGSAVTPSAVARVVAAAAVPWVAAVAAAPRPGAARPAAAAVVAARAPVR